MAIRIRNVKGTIVALCAAESSPEPNDLYLADTIHHALSEKFTADFKKMGFLRSKDEMSTKELLERGLIPAKSLIGIISVMSNDETAINLEKDKKYRFSRSELAELIDSIKQQS